MSREYLRSMSETHALPPAIEKFIANQLLRYSLAGYRLEIHPQDKIKKGEMTYTGEATATSLEIAIGGKWREWLGILVHETCHLDQHMEDKNSFDNAEVSLSKISSWLEGSTAEASLEDFNVVLENESDCEARSIEKIKLHNLPLDIPDYTRRANAYLASYKMAHLYRVWVPQPYRDDKLCSLLPSDRVLTASEIMDGSAPLPPAEEFLRLVVRT